MSPHFELPTDLLEPRPEIAPSHTLELLCITLGSHSNVFSDISNALIKLANFSAYLNENGDSPNFWRDDKAYFQNFLPVAHAILSLPRDEFRNIDLQPARILREAIRLASIVYLALIRRQFAIASDCVSICKGKLVEFLGIHLIEWNTSPSIRLWIFVVLAVADIEDSPTWVISHIVNALGELDIPFWEQTINHLREICWCKKLAQEELRILGQRLQRAQEI